MANYVVISDETKKYIKICLRKNRSITENIITELVERIAHLNDSHDEENESDLICPDEDKTIYSLEHSDIEDWLEDVLKSGFEEGLIKKVNGEIPSKILSGIQFKGTIADIAVKPKNRGPDDIVYQENETARLHIPRGFSILEYQNTDDGTSGRVCILYSNRKLFGETVDEDDFLERKRVNTENTEVETTEKDEPKGENYFLSDETCTERIISMEKVNGEAAHFAGRYIQGVFYLVAGSKSVHMIFRNENDIEEYSGDRYRIARPIALSVMRQWMSMNFKQRRCLAQFLHFSQATVVCEIMQPNYQHIVNFSELEDNKLVILCMTPPPTQYPNTLTAMPSKYTHILFKAFGFHTASYNELSLNEFDKHSIDIRHQKSSEGRVNYFEDSEGNTIGMVKLKTCWYIHLRALREQATFRFSRKGVDKPFEYYKTRSSNRMAQLQSFLNTPDEELKTWQIISDLWMEWVDSEAKNKGLTAQKIRGSFPTYWESFCSETNAKKIAGGLL